MRKAVALDSNLIVLLVVGLAGRNYIAKHKKLKTYTEDDFDILKATIEQSSGIVVTPNALSEASNFLRQIADPARSIIGSAFQSLIKNTSEMYVKSTDASQRTEFLRFGLADNVLLEVSKANMVIVSVDSNLCIAAQKSGYEAINFNHLRNFD